jgi:hypothetical protein
MNTNMCVETIYRVLKPLLSTYEEVLEALSGPGNAEIKDRTLNTYSRLKGFSVHLPALHAVNLIIAVPVVLSLLFPFLLSYVVFVLPALNVCISLSYLFMLSDLLRISVVNSLRNREGRKMRNKIVPDSKIATQVSKA